MSNLAKIVEWRGDVVENIHHALICIVNDKKQVLMQSGDIHDQPIFYRSALKPIQAIPVFESGIIEKYNITSRESALFPASHRGESYHIQELESLMDKLEIPENLLVCHQSYPLNEEPKSTCLWNHIPKRRLFHNCSGKHLGMIATAREKQWPIESYEETHHPLQQRILHILSYLSEIDSNFIHTGVDGCGVPVHAVPLYHMALSYLKLGCPDLINNESIKQAVNDMSIVMTKHPEMIASHQFICTALLEDSNIIAKGGAQGVYAFALKKERISVALKVQSGNENVWPILIACILERLHYQNQSTIQRLYQLRSKNIVNDGGQIIGKTTIEW